MMAIGMEAANDPHVSAAMQRIADATVDLYRALDDLGQTTPALKDLLASAVGSELSEQAVRNGRKQAAAAKTKGTAR